MNLYALLGISFIPALLFFALAVILNKNLKIRYCLLSGLLALLTVIPTSLIQYYVLELPIFTAYTFIAVMITAILFKGLIEEAMKMLFLCLIPQKKQILSAFFCCVILYGLTVGGFESVIYVIKKFQEIQGQGGKEIVVQLLLKRIFSAQAIHVFCAALSGLYIWNFRRHKKNIMPFIYAVILHGIYNFFVSFSSAYHWLAIIAILFAAVESRIFYLSAIDKNETTE
ncbi:MAG: PrsW family intramembrane metalloprotease [Treponema sp.]|uniref:PrsW family glutamic-type intramembrane protease n=1 Tax=Treponema sp. TaxID=166 RepID=UPI001B6D96A3|nr:PrsW family glutamic-type intramembrane protease [Treponema sp.]MBP3771690.1 PrsW family intramembrane metalloprotease [Treponema sp.]MBQ9282957.1 PrsW family intramembrane metalloprotease [Treponema sp.]